MKSKKNLLSISICMPIYKGSHLLKDSLRSVLRQGFSNFELLIGDDNPPGLVEEIRETKKIIRSFNDERIKYFKNKRNLGYARNLKSIVARAKNNVLFLMAQDDVLSRDALQKTHDGFFLDNNIGVVTRPYFWFMDNPEKPVRAVLPYDKRKDSVISIFDGEKEFMKIFESVGQLSGLAYRKEFITIPFNEEVFVAHIYPFAGILKNHKCVFLKDYTVAVGIKDSQTRSLSSIYDVSPTESWIRMYKTVFCGKKYEQQRKWGIKHMATNFEGLIQLKNYAKPGVLFREIRTMIENRWLILLNPKFWFFSMGAVIIPRKILVWLVDNYKSKVLSEKLAKTGVNF